MVQDASPNPKRATRRLPSTRGVLPVGVAPARWGCVRSDARSRRTLRWTVLALTLASQIAMRAWNAQAAPPSARLWRTTQPRLPVVRRRAVGCVRVRPCGKTASCSLIQVVLIFEFNPIQPARPDTPVAPLGLAAIDRVPLPVRGWPPAPRAPVCALPPRAAANRPKQAFRKDRIRSHGVSSHGVVLAGIGQ